VPDKQPNRTTRALREKAELSAVPDSEDSAPAVDPGPLLAADDAESIAQLSEWLKANSKTFVPTVAHAHLNAKLSPEASGAVLDALSWRVQAEEEATLSLMQSCLEVISRRVSASLAANPSSAISDRDDALVGSAVAALTADRRSRHSEAAVRCLADEGPGGALILARAFDVVRGGLKLYIIRHMDAADVLVLEDNVVACLSNSVATFAEELEGPKKRPVTHFLAALGPVSTLESSEIEPDEVLKVGDSVFHARWGAGTVQSADAESATIDFGSAGTRTLLRAYTKLRHGA